MTGDGPPALFISHGAPTFITEDIPARDFLRSLGRSLPGPDAILTVTAHWETEIPTISASAAPKTVHDFYGFPPELYDIEYKAPGAPDRAARVREIMGEQGIMAKLDKDRGFDHGTWVPLALMFPDADIPVLQLSVQPKSTPEAHFQTGRALSRLKDENVLVVGSGGVTHNLRAFGKWGLRHPMAPEARAFADWWCDKASQPECWDELKDYRKLAPFAEWNHPSAEHILPFFTVMGTGETAKRLHESTTYGMLAMDIYTFG